MASVNNNYSFSLQMFNHSTADCSSLDRRVDEVARRAVEERANNWLSFLGIDDDPFANDSDPRLFQPEFSSLDCIKDPELTHTFDTDKGSKELRAFQALLGEAYAQRGAAQKSIKKAEQGKATAQKKREHALHSKKTTEETIAMVHSSPVHRMNKAMTESLERRTQAADREIARAEVTIERAEATIADAEMRFARAEETLANAKFKDFSRETGEAGSG